MKDYEEKSLEFRLHANSINRLNYPLRDNMYDSKNPLLRPLYMYINHLQREILNLNARIEKLEKAENVQTMPEKTTQNVQEIDDMTPMDAWRIISANMQQLYKWRKAENPYQDWKGYTDAEIRAEVICFKALQEMQKKEKESNAKTPTQKEAK